MAPGEGGFAGRFRHVTRVKSGSSEHTRVYILCLVVAVAAGRLARGEVGKVETDNGFERLVCSAVA